MDRVPQDDEVASVRKKTKDGLHTRARLTSCTNDTATPSESAPFFSAFVCAHNTDGFHLQPDYLDMADHSERVVPAKRARPSDEDVDTVERDPEVWMEDGNIVIEAGNVAFKVYKGILAGRSEVFRDLFSVPSPAEVEAMDGVPIVHLQDSATDLKYLFLVLFCGKKYVFCSAVAICGLMLASAASSRT